MSISKIVKQETESRTWLRRSAQPTFKWVVLGMMFAPSLCIIVLFRYYPALRSIVGSLTTWNGFSSPTFVGFSNYLKYIHQQSFLIEFRNLVILLLAGIAIHVFIPFFSAELVTALPKGWIQGIVKYLMVLPMVIPQVIMIDIWAYILNPSTGPLDVALNVFHLSSIDWYGGSHTALISILLIGFPWASSLGYLIFLAGLQSVPSEVDDAIKLDGARTRRKIWSIHMPLCIPQFRFVAVLASVGIIQNFIPILLLTKGGPGNATMVPALDMYDNAFQFGQMGYGMAIGTVMFLVLMIVSALVFTILKPRT